MAPSSPFIAALISHSMADFSFSSRLPRWQGRSRNGPWRKHFLFPPLFIIFHGFGNIRFHTEPRFIAEPQRRIGFGQFVFRRFLKASKAFSHDFPHGLRDKRIPCGDRLLYLPSLPLLWPWQQPFLIHHACRPCQILRAGHRQKSAERFIGIGVARFFPLPYPSFCFHGILGTDTPCA